MKLIEWGTDLHIQEVLIKRYMFNLYPSSKKIKSEAKPYILLKLNFVLFCRKIAECCFN